MFGQGAVRSGRLCDQARGDRLDLSGQHTGTTDIPLTDNGRRLAERLAPALAKETFALVLVGPTAGAGDLRTGPPWRSRRDAPIWPSGITASRGADLSANPRAGARLAAVPGWMPGRRDAAGRRRPRGPRDRARSRGHGNVALFAHGHILRVLAARWIALPASAGQHFLLDTGTLSVLGYYQETPAMKIWNAAFANAA